MPTLIIVAFILWLAFHVIRFFWKWIFGLVIAQMVFDWISKSNPVLAHNFLQTLDALLRVIQEHLNHLNT
jgi:hypothetical protein